MMITTYFTADDDGAASSAAMLEHGPHEGVGGALGPATDLAELEATITGRLVEEVMDDERWAHRVGGTDLTEGPLVISVTDTLQDALAAMGDEQVARGGRALADTGGHDVDALEGFVLALAAMARLARERDARLYCWISL